MSDPRESDIAAWLKSIGLEQYAAAFIKNCITFDTLPGLTDEDLKACGVDALGHRKQILGAIRALIANAPHAAAATTAAAEIPKKLAHFELLEPIGRGGMGIIYRAWDSTLSRQVAIKLLDRQLMTDDPQFVEAFIREAKSAAGINHPHIVQIYFAGEDKGEHFIAMELLDGQSMADRLERGPMDEKMVLRLARQVVEALAATNARRLIHGDIKPHNIFITRNGDAKLLDFGLARKSKAGVGGEGYVTGSAAYISPERVLREPEDFRSDIYSLGATLFEALSGLPPFDADSPSEVATVRLKEDAPRLRSVRPGASEALDSMIARMLAREAGDRYPSYDALLADIIAAQSAPPGFDPAQNSMFTVASDVPGVMSVPSTTSVASAPMGLAASVGTVAGDGSPIEPQKPSLWRRVATKRFLFISIAAHLLFALIATVYVVQTITAKRKLTFTSSPPSPNPSQRALEHKVQMAKKQNTMSAPAQARRITSTGLAKVSLPDMPVISTSTDFTPGKMAGMGGTGMGLGMAGGMGGAGGGGGGGPMLFGLRGGNGLVGVLYDLKQTPDRKPTRMDKFKYTTTVLNYARGGWIESTFQHFYRATTTLYSAQIITPQGFVERRFNAAGMEKEIKPNYWVIHYQGRVSPQESGKYYFVGAGDDIMIVRFNGKIVLDRCWEPQIQGEKAICNNTANYDYGWIKIPNGFARGELFDAIAGQSYALDILIGEQPGGLMSAALLIEKEGATYQRDGKGNPILPVFRVAPQPPPPSDPKHSTAPHMMDGPVWQLKSTPGMGGGLGFPR